MSPNSDDRLPSFVAFILVPVPAIRRSGVKARSLIGASEVGDFK
jgi:hypothetical protein